MSHTDSTVSEIPASKRGYSTSLLLSSCYNNKPLFRAGRPANTRLFNGAVWTAETADASQHLPSNAARFIITVSFLTAGGCIQKFPERVDNEIYAYNNKHSLRNNTKGYVGKTH
jgi:hypothetical protein